MEAPEEANVNGTNGSAGPKEATVTSAHDVELGGAEYLDPAESAPPVEQEEPEREVFRREESYGLSQRLHGIRSWGPPAAGGFLVGVLVGFALWGRKSS